MKKIFFFAILSLCLASCRQEAVQPKVYGRYVPERKDDFAWENEYAAFRMYGPALKAENPSNGVDLWLKNSPALAVDTMYGRELKDNRPYHINYDGNLDCYKVGHTAGCGGVVAVADEQVWIGGPYDQYEILEQTPERFSFRLEYDSLLVGAELYRETIVITAEAGKVLNRAQVILTPCQPLAQEQRLLLGGGIYLHDTLDACRIDSAQGLIAYAEDALSDRTAAQMNYDYNGSTSQGRSYIAVLTPGATRQKVMNGTLVSVRPYTPGDTLTYYFGACWSEWRDGGKAFPTDEDWFDIKNWK